MQTYQVSCISQETPAFWSHLPFTHRITKISRILAVLTTKILLRKGK